MIRVALVDDQAIVRTGLARILSPADGFEVIAECRDGRQALDELPELAPDVVLMDVRNACVGRDRRYGGAAPGGGDRPGARAHNVW
jgi:DNA-binding NarL/FixJ family response regulator